MSDEVVITGMGIVSPIGCGEAAFWDALCNGRSGAAEVTGFDVSELPRKIACQVKEPIAGDEGVGRASKLAVTAMREAVAVAKLDLADLERCRIAVIVGTTMGETEFIEERLDAPQDEWLSDDHLKRIATGRPGSIAGNVLARLTGGGGLAQAKACGSGSAGATSFSEKRVRDGSSAVDLYGACAAGNMAIASGRQQLLDGRCDVAIAGGADGFSRLAFIGFMRLRAMTAEICRPFDERRDGLLVGEGGVIFVLERESTARARGAPIRARVLGTGSACEDYHPTRPHPEGDGLTRATLTALRDARLDPSDIDYVCAHGTGTPQNDVIEVAVMQKCFPRGVAFSSIKGLTGHPMGAAGALEAAACVLSLENQKLIPTWHLDNLLQPCSLDAVRDAVRAENISYVLNNSAGFGGYNSSLVLGAV